MPENVHGEGVGDNVITIKFESPSDRWPSVRDVIVTAWGIAVLAALVTLLGRG